MLLLALILANTTVMNFHFFFYFVDFVIVSDFYVCVVSLHSAYNDFEKYLIIRPLWMVDPNVLISKANLLSRFMSTTIVYK